MNQRLDVSDITFGYGERLLFSNFSIAAEPGEICAIMGASGVGKSTLLRLISGYLQPKCGSVRLDGEPVATARRRDSLSMMFQDDRLLEWLTVGENVEIGLPVQSDENTNRLVKELLEAVGLPEHSAMFPRQLSGGMRQRVALCRALAREPSVLLLDEPFGSVDLRTRERLTTLVKALLDSPRVKTPLTFFVSHSAEEAVLLSTRIIVLGGEPARCIFDSPNAQAGTWDRLYVDPEMLDRVRALRQLLRESEI